ncbi:PRC-barrel domain-containing protein [Methylobacterium durans]|uniref:PRC-barrel domain-containing protein n=1 Tax=Methylobacterium durans TaxID=2202825 RepID=UPI001F46ED45|nr:PRC-barrel domain-containing protein [Methylobacterium durans]
MFRPFRIIASATAVLWAAGAAAETAPTGGEPATSPSPSPTQPAPASAPTQPNPVPPPAAPPVATVPVPAPAPPAAPQQGTPATVLDTQDYEGVLGKGVRAANGDELGRIIDVIIDKDGRPRAAIIDFGGFLGVGSRKIAVDWRSLRFSPEGKAGRVVLQLSRNQVRVSPEYKAGEPIVVLGPASPGGPAPDGDPAAPAAQPAATQPAAQPPQPPPQAAPQGIPPGSAAAPVPADKPPERAPDR